MRRGIMETALRFLFKTTGWWIQARHTEVHVNEIAFCVCVFVSVSMCMPMSSFRVFGLVDFRIILLGKWASRNARQQFLKKMVLDLTIVFTLVWATVFVAPP